MPIPLWLFFSLFFCWVVPRTISAVYRIWQRRAGPRSFSHEYLSSISIIHRGISVEQSVGCLHGMFDSSSDGDLCPPQKQLHQLWPTLLHDVVCMASGSSSMSSTDDVSGQEWLERLPADYLGTIQTDVRRTVTINCIAIFKTFKNFLTYPSPS